MPDIGFTIPANSVPNNLAIHSELQITPDINLNYTTSPEILLSEVSGASQRSVQGINPLRRIFNLTFNNRPVEEADFILQYFRQRKGVEPFILALADPYGAVVDSQGTRVSTYEVVCIAFSVTYISCDLKSISATFKKVHNTTANYIPTSPLVIETKNPLAERKDP